MIEWNHLNIKDVYFSILSSHTPTSYPSNYFDLVFGISVLTHLPSEMQVEWLQEIARIIKPSGIFLATTMGSFYYKQLFSKEKELLDTKGILEKSFHRKNIFQPGDRNFSVYETANYFEKIIEPNFHVIEYYDGSLYPEKFGGQDLWILQKK